MQLSLFFATLLSTAALAKNSKINQYATIADCQSDSNIISHASPSEGSCHNIDVNTGALYLVVGDGAAAGDFWGKTESGCSCQANNTNVPQETCIALPENTKSILFGLDDQGPGCGST